MKKPFGTSRLITILSFVALAHLSSGFAMADPNPPTNIQATQPSSAPIVVSWNPPAGGDPVASYKVYRSKLNNLCGIGDSIVVGTPGSAATSFNDTPPTTGEVYYYRVTSVNAGAVESACPDQPPYGGAPGWIGAVLRPNPPNNLSATQQLGTFVTVSWSAPTAASNREPESGYTLFRALTPDPCPSGGQIGPALIGVGTTSYNDTTAVPGTVYWYSMKSRGLQSGVDGTCTPTPVQGTILLPPPPTLVSGTQGTFPDKVELAYIPPNDPTNFINHYRLHRSTTPANGCSDGGSKQIAVNAPSPLLVTLADGIVPGRRYYWTMESIAAPGNVIKSQCGNEKDGYAKIGPVADISATDGTFPNKVDVTWTAPTNGGDITGYNLYRDLTPNPCGTGTKIITTAGGVLSHSDTSVTPGVIYHYSVETISPTGVSTCVQDPGHARVAPVQNISATDGTFTNKVEVTWTAPTVTAGVTGYNLYRDTSSNPCASGTKITSPASSATSYTDTAVTPGVIYHYSIETVSAAGVSTCVTDPGHALTQCTDNIDNDGDSRVDLVDPGCTGPTDNDESGPPICSDGLDNDGDGKIDFPADPGCTSPTDDDEQDPPVCSDGKDNDGDGKIDFPADPGCISGDDNNESDVPICNDGLDNDGDGQIDFPLDKGCDSLDDDDETDDQFVCDDGKDNDGDGKIDFRVDTNGDPGCNAPTDPSEDDEGQALKSPAFQKFNTFLGQQNFAELVNQGDQPKEVKLTVYNLRGEEMISRTVVVPATSELDININELVMFACDILKRGCEGFSDLSQTAGTPNGLGRPDGVVDTYGLVGFEFDDSNKNQRLLGRISFYRPNEDGTYSFAMAREFRNPISGTSYATTNTYDPRGAGFLVPNWIEVISFGERNAKGELVAKSKKFRLNIYNQAGSLVHTEGFTLPALGEFDFHGGHEFVGSEGEVIEGVYLAEVVPSDPKAEYFLSVARYSSNAPPAAEPATYNFATVSEGFTGTGEQLFAPISNTVQGVSGLAAIPFVANWVEVACISSVNCVLNISYRDADGTTVAQQVETLKSKAQGHFNAGDVLPKGTNGSVRIQVVSGRTVAQSMSYLHGTDNALQTGFVAPARTRGRASLAGSINTFLGMQDVLHVYATRSGSVDANFSINLFSGGTANGALGLNGAGASTVSLSSSGTVNIPDNTFGALQFDTAAEGDAHASVCRARVDAKGEMDFLFCTLVK